MPQSPRDRIRRWIARALWTGGGLTIVVAVAGAVWMVLSAANDFIGSAGARGVFLTTVVLWGINFVVLVVLTALCQIVETDGDDAADV